MDRKSFNEFKEFESYWLEYVGDDTYIGRSDNILNQRLHITPQQLFTLFTHQHCTKDNEKQGEQKPVDKAEPKFKIGDWITNGDPLWQITNIDRLDYTIKSQNDDVVEDSINYIDNEFHIWTIQDVKDGDILYHKSQLTGIEYIVMSRGVNGCGNIDSYFRYNSKDGFDISVPSVFNTKLDSITPATKEQCDLLFSKMKEAGYEWDAKKKELKKIEQKPAWSEEDEHYKNGLIGLVEDSKAGLPINLRGKAADKCIDWLKSLKDRVQPQPKKEWNVQDEDFLGDAIYAAKNTYSEKCGQEELIDWLKSLKPNHWKPSEEQLKAIIDSAQGLYQCKEKEVLLDLYEQLKNL